MYITSSYSISLHMVSNSAVVIHVVWHV